MILRRREGGKVVRGKGGRKSVVGVVVIDSWRRWKDGQGKRWWEKCGWGCGASEVSYCVVGMVVTSSSW